MLVTVIDESVLNTNSDSDVRKFIASRFVVKAIVSLPYAAFVEAGPNVKTSILFLVKKHSPDEEQPYTFFARCENIGYDVRRRPDLTKNELPDILIRYRDYAQKGIAPTENKSDWSQKSRFFIHRIKPNESRFDFEYLDPRHEEMKAEFEKLVERQNYETDTLERLCTVFRGSTAERYVSSGVSILKVRNVTGEGINWDTDHVLKEFFDSHASRRLHPLDVLITSTGFGTIGRADMVDHDVPCMTDSHVTALRIKDQTRLSAYYLLSYLRSVFGQMQIERFTVGSTGQLELNKADIGGILVLFPKLVTGQEAVVAASRGIEDLALQAQIIGTTSSKPVLYSPNQ